MSMGMGGGGKGESDDGSLLEALKRLGTTARPLRREIRLRFVVGEGSPLLLEEDEKQRQYVAKFKRQTNQHDHMQRDLHIVADKLLGRQRAPHSVVRAADTTTTTAANPAHHPHGTAHNAYRSSSSA